MTWMKVDDNLHAHRKPRKAGVPAMGLWVMAGSWSSDMLSDGFVPDYIAQSIDPDSEVHAESLVRAGLWEAAEQDGDEGWRFVGWHEYQPMKSDVQSKREQWRDKKARQRRNSEGQFEESSQSPPDVPGGHNADSPGDSLGESRGSHTVPSRPVPSRNSSRNRRVYTDDFEAFWQAYPLRKEKGKAFDIWEKLDVPTERLVQAATAYANDPNRDPKYTKHPKTWLNQECWEDEYAPPREEYSGWDQQIS